MSRFIDQVIAELRDGNRAGPWALKAMINGMPVNSLETSNLKKVRKFLELAYRMKWTVRHAYKVRRLVGGADVIAVAKKWQPEGPWSFSAIDGDHVVHCGCRVLSLDAADFAEWLDGCHAQGLDVVLQRASDGKALPLDEALKRAEGSRGGVQ